MTNELEEMLNERIAELIGNFDRCLNIMKDNPNYIKDPSHIGISEGIKAIYLQNEIIIDYLQNIYKNQSEVKK